MDIAGEIVTKYFDAYAKLAPLFCLKRSPKNAVSDELAENGVVVLPNLIPPDLIADINRKNQPFFNLSEPSELIYSPDGKALLEMSQAPEEVKKDFYFLHIKSYQWKFDVRHVILPYIAPILESYFRSRYFIRDVYCYRTQPVPAVQGSYAWHTDNYPRGSHKVMVYLTDVSADQGPFSYALKSHQGFKPRLGQIGPRFDEKEVKGRYRTVDGIGKRGTVIIFNNNGIHRATDPRTGYRDVVNFTVFPCVFPRNGNSIQGLDLQEEKKFLKKYTR